MTDYGPPVLIGGSEPGGNLKVKRGGTGGGGNSGNARPRFYTPNACLRVTKGGNKTKTHHGGKVLAPPPRAPVVWDPRDPFIIEFQKARREQLLGQSSEADSRTGPS